MSINGYNENVDSNFKSPLPKDSPNKDKEITEKIKNISYQTQNKLTFNTESNTPVNKETGLEERKGPTEIDMKKASIEDLRDFIKSTMTGMLKLHAKENKVSATPRVLLDEIPEITKESDHPHEITAIRDLFTRIAEVQKKMFDDRWESDDPKIVETQKEFDALSALVKSLAKWDWLHLAILKNNELELSLFRIIASQKHLEILTT